MECGRMWFILTWNWHRWAIGRLLDDSALISVAHVQGRGCTAEHMDFVLHTLLHHFGRRQRWPEASRFFSKLLPIYPVAAV
jgi:hypothetical protein